MATIIIDNVWSSHQITQRPQHIRILQPELYRDFLSKEMHISNIIWHRYELVGILLPPRDARTWLCSLFSFFRPYFTLPDGQSASRHSTNTFTVCNKKLIRRWDDESELSLRRHCTSSKNRNRLLHKFRRRSFSATQVYQIERNNAM